MLLALVTVLAATVVAAEPTTSGAGSHGVVVGTVTLTDAKGETFDAPGVELTLTCEATPGEPSVAASDGHGLVRFADVRPGRCSLTADLQGFATMTTDVLVPAGKTLQAEIHLEVTPVDSGVRAVSESTCSWHTGPFN
jgi:Carboxypeptidase regulatory-like domain